MEFIQKAVWDTEGITKAGLRMLPCLGGEGIDFDEPITFLTGENGSGKSTMLESIAVAYGFNPEGGSLHFRFATNHTHEQFDSFVRLWKTHKRPKRGFFLRAESFYNMATYIDEIFSPSEMEAFGGRSLHCVSHGESFMNLIQNRFLPHGLYLLDEPESALSPTNQMALLSLLAQLSKQNCQMIVATHSPILMACPNSAIYVLSQEGAVKTPYDETEHVTLMRYFLNHPQKMVEELCNDETEL